MADTDPSVLAPTDNDPPALISIRGARQHNLKNLDLDLQTGTLTVVTGPSGSGKSSLVFDTLFAEGQRRYVETFSAYARQFLDRMDKPAVDKVEGVPPAIAIDQTNPVRTSRSTVGTMTELNDHLKLWFARAARLFDRVTALPVQRDNPGSVWATLQQRCAALAEPPRLVLTFPARLPASATEVDIAQWLTAQGFARFHDRYPVPSTDPDAPPLQAVEVVVDRFRWGQAEPARVMEAIELALARGDGHMAVHVLAEPALTWRFARGLHCPESGLGYSEPTPAWFSFNSAVGACGECRGFGRVIGVDWGLVVPDGKLTLRGGAIKPMQTPAYQECQEELLRFAEVAGIPRDLPWSQLSEAQRAWVLQGDPAWAGDWKQQWYGVRRFFAYLESKAYKMHIRVLLSKYRSYTECPVCRGARLKTDSLLWRVGTRAQADAVLPPAQRFMPSGVAWSAAQLQALPGLHLHDLMGLPIERLRVFCAAVRSDMAALGGAEAEAVQALLTDIDSRLRYLCEVGIGYLTLDRQSRTLSGGEVQRINLTTALGTSLVKTLFVLDEPSIGLHPRDMERINQAMLRLRDAGNTLVVVEHDPAVMLQADRVLDMGPGPGERGGQIVFDGSPTALAQADTLTGAYLGGRKQVGFGFKRMVTEQTPRLVLHKVRQHNLRGLTVALPLQRLVTITGVSGSGKSTLVQDVLAPALCRHFGQATEAPGAHDGLSGAEALSGVVFVDQSPIGKTARSNPVSYVGAWDAIRDRFAATPEARQRAYTAAKFSFNGGDGRCPTCGGSGFEHVEMQFLSDVYLRCPDCDGQRYRPEVLEVRLQRGGRSCNVAEVLQLTVSEALQWFAQDTEVVQALQPLSDVGLEYLRLGQPVPTLSGGEAQRLKLAAHLAEATRRPTGRRRAGGTAPSRSGQPLATRGQLFLFDEPTTGLHFDDIAKLMRALRKLLEVGHSLLVIEHNLDVIRASDWLIDLGPEGGEQGGQIVAEGRPEDVRLHPQSHTARALRDYAEAMGELMEVQEQRADYAASGPPLPVTAGQPWPRRAHPPPAPPRAIQIVNAREHNLQGVDATIALGRFNVVTGVSGSGKSTLAFDILFNEGQRRYLESLNAYARSMVQPAGRPEVDAVYGIPPTVAIEQRLSRGGRKSTVGTATEVWHFLRLLYVKLGVQHCVHDGSPVQPQTPDRILAQLMLLCRGRVVQFLAPLVRQRKGVYTEWAEWAKARGHRHLRVDGAYVSTEAFPRLDRFREHTIELPLALLPVEPEQESALRAALTQALEWGKGVVHLLVGVESLPEVLAAGESGSGFQHVQVYSTLRACPTCATSYPEPDPRAFSYNSKQGWCPACVGTGVALTTAQREALDDSLPDGPGQGREHTFAEPEPDGMGGELCAACGGTRLHAVSRAVRFQGVGIAELAGRSVGALRLWVRDLQHGGVLSGREAEIARDLLPEIEARLAFLEEVGLGYLTLDRGAPTLSGGEAQRIRLAAQLGSCLQGVCYVLDEPTIGLHPRDNRVLLEALARLGERGNTLVVVEHDADTIRRADRVLDIGPGAGRRGGRLLSQGSVAELLQHPESQTGRCLREPMHHPLQARRPVAGEAGLACLRIEGAHLHHLRDLDVALPLRRLVAVTGVSGSGKSSLAREVLWRNVAEAVAQGPLATQAPGWVWHGCRALHGHEAVQRVLEVDQTPIGKTPRSCPATYIGFWDAIRKLYADTLEAKVRGYGPGRFSFNTGAGRCPACEGQGMQTVAMGFLPEVKVLCEVCRGARFNAETLAVQWRGHSIGAVLQMEVDQALGVFASVPAIAHPLRLLQEVGLGYLTLGQASPTLSGGEAQRLKLVTELSKVRDDVARRGQTPPHTLYVLDEPTVGLHMADVAKLVRVLHRLVDAGHSVVVIEHDLDVIAEADWVLDLGPEGGAEGGCLVGATTPEGLVALGTHTGLALAGVLARSVGPGS